MSSIRTQCRDVLAAALVVGFAATSAGAATYTISTRVDDVENNGNCTLREALLAATSDSAQDLCAGDPGPDTIVLDAIGTYPLGGTAPILGFRELTVRGDGDHAASDYVVYLGGERRLLSAWSGATLVLENLTLTGGAGAPRGGALLVEDSDLTLRRVTVSESDVVDPNTGDGGGVAFLAQSAQQLVVEEARFSDNRAAANQAFGGGLYVNLQNGGEVRIVRSEFLGNRIEASTGSFNRNGGGIYLRAGGAATIDLRHLRFSANVIAAPSFAAGAGAYIRPTESSTLLLEDALFDLNEFTGTTIGAAGVAFSIPAETTSIEVRRLRVVGNLAGPSVDQASIQVAGGTQAVVSDLLVAAGPGGGLFLDTSGLTCDLVAGNLTLTQHDGIGLSMSQNGCPLRIENSILYDNSPNQNVYFGAPEISAETMIGIDPEFVDPATLDFRLAAGSDAIDAGDQTFASVGPYDTAHATRVVGLDVDLGALERGAIFADGFETGDPYAFSSFVP